MLSSIALAAGLGVLIHRSILKQSGVHIAVLMLALAIFDALLSAVCEALHILIFSWNGRGMALLDFASSFFESQTDMIISFLLVSIASGWTLGNAMVPSSSLSFNGQRNAAGGEQVLVGLHEEYEAARPHAVALWLHGDNCLRRYCDFAHVPRHI